MHTATRSSYLSPEGQGLWTSKHDGLFNLGSVILVATNFRLILENLLKYGLRMNLLTWAQRSLSGQGNLQLVACFPALLVFAMLSLGAEKLGSLWLKEERQVGECTPVYMPAVLELGMCLGLCSIHVYLNPIMVHSCPASHISHMSVIVAGCWLMSIPQGRPDHQLWCHPPMLAYLVQAGAREEGASRHQGVQARDAAASQGA